MKPEGRVYVNGIMLDAGEAHVSAFDRGFLYGDGVYETLRVFDGRVFRPNDHLKRLLQSAHLVGMDAPFDSEHFAKMLSLVVTENNLSDAVIRVTVSRGVGGTLGSDLPEQPTVVASFRPRVYPQVLYDEGVVVHVTDFVRDPRFLDPRIKSLNFLPNVLAVMESHRVKAHEAILLTPDGRLSEGASSNLFFVDRDGALWTAADGTVLSGITRDVVLKSARKRRIKVVEEAVSPDDVESMRECFITSTGRGVLPVASVGETAIGSAVPGEKTRLFMEDYRKELLDKKNFQPVIPSMR
ncbi:Amino-transferase class IV [uncultured archaeon]|nr:Amino-transferase class IV [uncultured archaeon]